MQVHAATTLRAAGPPLHRIGAGAGRHAASHRREAEPGYYLKITLRTARFAERCNATVLQDGFESWRVAQHGTLGRVYREKNRDG
ncbi:hypothetical protein [Burkholderia sp. AU45388]|uniref:hypothetical protein n=1 Tax=Burkholderia sp. AU45388 TaxID=3059206 RepID=UPI00264D838B|nr:hypothetical protein [Burkholderia sp. AU45388]MDN7425954.1 hypothetical protein [Burkholderia sp. AU45388]